MNVRTYRMTARAEAVAATRERILDAAYALFFEHRDLEPAPLGDVATRAGTTVQTVLRHFGTRQGLIEALIRRESDRVMAERDEVPPGDVRAVAAYLARHYGEMGDDVIGLLCAERRSPAAASAVAEGRRRHREWVGRVFAPVLEGLRGRGRRRRLELLVAATDVHTWKLLCRDGGLDATEYRRAVEELLSALAGRR